MNTKKYHSIMANRYHLLFLIFVLLALMTTFSATLLCFKIAKIRDFGIVYQGTFDLYCWFLAVSVLLSVTFTGLWIGFLYYFLKERRAELRETIRSEPDEIAKK